MRWSGIDSGDSRQLAVSERIRRRFKRLLEVLQLSWSDLESARFPTADYRDEEPDVLVTVARADGKEDPDLYVLMNFLPEPDDDETYFQIQFKTERRKTSRGLIEEVLRHRGLRLPGVRVATSNDYEWFVRALPLSELESSPREQQLGQVVDFVRETLVAVQDSGVLDAEVPRKKSDKDGEEQPND